MAIAVCLDVLTPFACVPKHPMFRVYFHEEFDKQDLTIHEQEGKVFFFEYVKGRRGRKLPERNIFRTNATSDYMRNSGRERDPRMAS